MLVIETPVVAKWRGIYWSILNNKQWLVAWGEPSNYLNQCWLIIINIKMNTSQCIFSPKLLLMIKMYLKTEFPLIFYHFQGPTRLNILSPPHVIFLLFFLFVICKQTFIVQQTALQYAKAGGSQCQNVRLWFMIVQNHYSNVIMSVMASQITSRTIIYSNVYSGTDQRNHQNSASMAFWGGIHQWPANSPYKGQ